MIKKRPEFESRYKQLIKRIVEKYRENDNPFDLVYAYEFPQGGVGEDVSEAEVVGVTWMLDILSAMRLRGDEALNHIRRGPPA